MAKINKIPAKFINFNGQKYRKSGQSVDRIGPIICPITGAAIIIYFFTHDT